MSGKWLLCLCHLPMTLFAKEVLIRVASPRSPILTDPVGPVMKMLSHLRSRWTIGGVLVWRKWRPFRICLHQLLRTLGFITLKRLRYLCREQKWLESKRILGSTNRRHCIMITGHGSSLWLHYIVHHLHFYFRNIFNITYQSEKKIWSHVIFFLFLGRILLLLIMMYTIHQIYIFFPVKVNVETMSLIKVTIQLRTVQSCHLLVTFSHSGCYDLVNTES